MANRTINTILAMKDQFSSPAKKVVSKTRNIKREIKRTKNQVRKLGKSFKRNMGRIAKYGALAGTAIAVAFGKQSLDAAKAQIEAETKLHAVLKNVKGVTEQQVESIKKICYGSTKAGGYWR